MEFVTEAKEVAFTNQKVNNNPLNESKPGGLWLVFAHWSENKGVQILCTNRLAQLCKTNYNPNNLLL